MSESATVAAAVETVLLIDLSSIVHPLWHISANDPDPNATSRRAVADILSMAGQSTHVAICCDAGRSFRKDIAASYKANRAAEKNAPLYHQVDLAAEELARCGFPVWKVDGFEADDLIASATQCAKALGHPVVIATADKDLLQLVDDSVQVLSTTTKALIGPNEVFIKFGVSPDQMGDYLALVGDTSDNIAGVRGVGPKTAAKWLDQWVDLEGITKHIVDIENDKPALAKALIAASDDDSLMTARKLVTLRTDAPVTFDDIYRPRVSATAEDSMTETLAIEPEPIPAPEPASVNGHADPPSRPMQSIAVIESAGEWGRQLEPRNLDDARTIAKWLYTSRLFAAYGAPEAIFSIILAGRELGLGTMASLRGFHIVEGRPTMAADLMRALVLASGRAEYFSCKSRTALQSTWVTRRKGDPIESDLTYTLEDAKTANLVRPNSGWVKHPADMLAKTASAKLCRMVYPDVTFGLYAPEELGGNE